jgi:hypothetical protein
MTSVDASPCRPDVSLPGDVAAIPGTTDAEPLRLRCTNVPPRQVRPPTPRSLSSVFKALAPYLAVYVIVGILMLRWGGTDPSQNNVSYAWEWFTIPLVVALSYLVCVPIALLGWAWGRMRRALHLAPKTPPAPAASPPAPQPTCFSFKSQLWPQHRRWMAAEGQLVLDDEMISFNPPGSRHRGAVSVPWSSVTSLRLRPRIAWGRGQRGHLTIGVRSGRPIELMLPRPQYDRLALLLGTVQVDRPSVLVAGPRSGVSDRAR